MELIQLRMMVVFSPHSYIYGACHHVYQKLTQSISQCISSRCMSVFFKGDSSHKSTFSHRKTWQWYFTKTVFINISNVPRTRKKIPIFTLDHVVIKYFPSECWSKIRAAWPSRDLADNQNRTGLSGKQVETQFCDTSARATLRFSEKL